MHQQQSKRSASVDPHNRSAESSGDDAEGAAASRHVSLQTQKHHQRRVNNNDRHEATTGYQYIADDHHRQHIAAEQHQQRVQQEYQRRVVGVAAGEVAKVASSPLSIPSHSRRSRAAQKLEEEHHSPYSSPRGNSNHAAVPTTTNTKGGFVHATSNKHQQRGARHHQHHHHQPAEAAAPSITPHSYTIALRAQWSALSRLMREEGLGGNGGDAEYDGGVPSSVLASRIAVRSGLDVEITRLLAAIRSDATAVVHEADVLLPLLLALSIAPIPTESSQTLAAEVLAKVLVAAHRQSVTSSAQQHNSTTTAQQQQQQMIVQRRRMLENFLVHHRALDALEIALRTSVSSTVTTSILELYFVVASISPQSSNAILANPSLIQTLMALLPAGVPAHICYVATLLQSLTQSSPIDGATILCSYDVHHAMLAFLDDHLEDEITVTAVGMLLRVVLVLLHGCPQAFRQAFATTTTSVSATATHHRPNGPHALARLIRRCIGSVWSDIADLGCLLLTSHLQRHHSARLERNVQGGGGSAGGRSTTARRRSDAVGVVSEHAPTLEELRDFTRVEMLLETPSSSSAAWPNSTTSLVNASSSRRPSTSQFAAAATAVPNDLILVLSSLICATPTTAMPQQGHLRISSACALLWLSFHAPIRVGELIANDPIVIHNLVSTLLESFSDDESIHPNAAATSSDLTSIGHNGESPSRRRQAASSSGLHHPTSPSSQPYHQAHRTLTALTMLTILFVGSPRSRLSLTTHLQRHLSKMTRATLFQRLLELLSLADDTLLSALLFDVRGAREAASVDPAAAADGQQQASPSHEYQLHKLRQALLTVARDVLLTVPKMSSIAAATNHSTSFSSSRYDNHNGDHHQKQHHHEMLLTPGGMASAVTRLVDNAVVLRDQPRSSAHSATFIHNSIRNVVRLASNYLHNNSSGNNQHPLSSDSDASNSSSKNLWAAPTRHAVDRRWSVEHLERNDVYLFDCPVEQITPGLHEVMEGLSLHVARLKHELNLNSMSKPMRRCVLQDLYSHVYPTMLTCLQFIAQSLSSDEHAANTIRMIADGGGSRAISSANIVDIYHAVGLSMQQQQQRKNFLLCLEKQRK